MTARDRFDLHESVGRDALGEVFRATERSSGKKAALKVFDDLALKTREGREAYLEALRVLREILPARTPPISGFSLRSDDGWVASRWVEGVTLHQYLDENGPMDFADAASVATGILDALDELHSSGQAHGGLSPRKILLIKGAEAGGVVVTDPFQHHLYSVTDPIKTSRSDPERFFGLPEYFSPEQAQGKPPDERSDVYVVGLMLYEMLTGKSTFGAKSVSTTLKRQIYERPLAPRHARPGLEAPDDAEIIINMALNKSREDRFQSALAFRRALNNLRDADETSERAAEPMGISPVGVLVGKPVPTGELEALPIREETEASDGDEAELDSKDDDDGRASTIAFSPSELAKRMADGFGEADIPQGAQDHETQPANGDELDSAESDNDRNRAAHDGDDAAHDGDDAAHDSDDAAHDSDDADDRSTMAFSPADVAATIAAAKASKDESEPDSSAAEAATSESGSDSSGESVGTSSKRSRGKKKRKKRGGSRSGSAANTVTKPEKTESQTKSEPSPESDKPDAPLLSKSLSAEEREAEGQATPTGPINVDDDELNWFAIGDDVGALTERHEAIADVNDTDENATQNKRFVFGAIAAIVVGILAVMAAATLSGGDERSEGAREDTTPAEETSGSTPAPSPAAAEAIPDEALAAATPEADAEWEELTDDSEGSALGSEAGTADTALQDDAEPNQAEEPEPLAVAVDEEDEPEAEPNEREPEPEVERQDDEEDDQEAARAAAREREAQEAAEEAAEEAARDAIRQTASDLADEGQSALRSGNWSEAQRLFGESLQHYDGSASAQAGLGQAHFEQRNYSQAARYFRAATRINSRNAGYHDSLGQAYFRLGNLDAALSAFEQAEERGHANGARNVALVRDRIGAGEAE